MLNKWNSFWKNHKVSNLALWNLIVFGALGYFIIRTVIAKGSGDAEGYAFGILLLEPVVFGTVLYNLFHLFRRLKR